MSGWMKDMAEKHDAVEECRSLYTEIEKLETERDALRKRLTAHHNIAHLSDEAVRDYFGAPGGCGICREALRDERSGK